MRQTHLVGARIRVEVLEVWGVHGLGILQPYGLLEGAALMSIEGGQSC